MLIQVIALFLLCSIVSSYFVPPVLFGNVIRDLYSNSTNDMTMLAAQWTSIDANTFKSADVKSSSFSGKPMLGGLDVLSFNGIIYRRYTGLPVHNVVYYDIALKINDTWANTNTLNILLGSWKYFYMTAPTQSDIVPGYPGLMTPHLVGKFYHTYDFLEMEIQYLIGNSAYSWLGIRDVSLSLRNEPYYDDTGYITLLWSSTAAPRSYASEVANCSAGYYKNGGLCVSCHVSCQNCFGSSNAECYSCASGFSFIGNQCLQCPLNCAFCSGVNLGQCLLCNAGYTLDFDGTCNPSNTCKTSPFVIKNNADVSPNTVYSSSFCAQPCSSGAYTLWNYTCTNTCNPPLQQVSMNGALLCQFPCNKTNNEYLHPNGSCLSSCSYSPVNETGYLFCGSFCQNYLYQNQSCLPTCPAPYVTGVSLGVNTCNYPCATGQYLYPNGSCIATCPQLYTVRVENSSLFCSYPCTGNEFLYSNGTCSSTCQANFLITMDGSDKFCNYPCQIGSYLYDNGTCLETCSPGFTVSAQGLYQYCRPSCPSNNYFYYNGICLSSCPVGTYQDGGTCNLCDSSCITCNGPFASQCLSCPSNRLLINGKCLCPSDTYLYANGSCLSTCQSGFSVVIEGGIKYCNSPNSSSNSCTNSSFYKYQNGSCLSTCPYPFTSGWLNGSYFCNSPCSAGWFLYENGTCLPSCGSGFETRIEDGITFCDSNQTTNPSNSNLYPCYITSLYDTNIMITNCSNLNQNNACPPGYFQYQNGSCLHLCIDPYLGILRNGSAYCYSPSSFPDDQPGCANNSCLPGDNSTNTNSTGNSTDNNNNTSTNQTDNGNSTSNNTDTNNSTTYTNGCSGANFYKYSNGSCLATCPSPFLFVWQNGAAYCDFPCSSGYYISINGTCITSCDPGYTPRIQGYLMFCDSNNVSNGTSSGGTNSSHTNTTDTTNTPSVLLQIYIRYNISLIDFNSLNGLTLFVQQLASLLGIDPSYITIVSIREGSTIIESQISIASASDQESMNTAMSLAETMSDTVSNAVTNNELNTISGVSILDYKKSIQVVKTASSDNQIQASSGSSNSGVVIGLGVGLGVLGLIVIGFAINRYKKNTKLNNMRTKQDTPKGEAYKVEANVNKISQEVKDESMARINDYKEGETVKSHRLDEIDIRIEGSGINNNQRPEQQAIELDVGLGVQAIEIEPKFIKVERKASTNQEYKLEPNMRADQEMRNDSSLKSQEIQACNEIEPTKQLSFVQPESSISIEGLDFYIEGKPDQKDQQEDHNAEVDVVVEGREVENANIEKQEDAEEKPMSLGALLKQNL